MIHLCLIDKKRIDTSNRDFFGTNLTGYTVVIKCETKSILGKYSRYVWRKWEEYSDLWVVDDHESVTITFELIDQIESGGVYGFISRYLAVVLAGGNGDIIGWQEVEIDNHSVDENGDGSTDIYINAFGFSTRGLKDSEIIELNEFDVTLYDSGRNEYLAANRSKFRQHQPARVYNELREQQVKLNAAIERFSSLSDTLLGLRALRSERSVSYTEITYWKEFDLRHIQSDVEREIFKSNEDVTLEYGKTVLETLWHERLDKRLILDNAEVKIDNILYLDFFTLKELENRRLSEGDLFVRILPHRSYDDCSVLTLYKFLGFRLSDTTIDRTYWPGNSQEIENLVINPNEEVFLSYEHATKYFRKPEVANSPVSNRNFRKLSLLAILAVVLALAIAHTLLR